MNTPTHCLICQSALTTHFLDARDYASGEMFTLQRCDDCGFVFTWPQPDDLNKYYPAYYRRYGSLLFTFFRFLYGRRTASWARAYGHAGRALEVGCGNGWMLDSLRQRGWQVIGTERTPASAQFARTQLKLTVVVGGLNALREGEFDLIILQQVLEHLPDPVGTLSHCAKLLKPSGHLVVGVPNMASWQFRFSRQHWQHLDVPRHLGHFTPHSIRKALEHVGLHVERIDFVSPEHDPYGWLQSALNKFGFPQNLLLRWLSGEGRGDLFKPTGLLMVLITVFLAPLAVLLALLSWIASKGALMEVRAVRLGSVTGQSDPARLLNVPKTPAASQN